MSNRGWWDDYRGIPFLSHGRDRNGCDCWGLVRMVYAEQFGIDIPSYIDVYEDANGVDFSSATGGRLADWQETDSAIAGDVVLMRVRTRQKVDAFHVGLVVCPRRRVMLHIHEGINVCTERYDGPMWSRRLAGVWRHNAR